MPSRVLSCFVLMCVAGLSACAELPSSKAAPAAATAPAIAGPSYTYVLVHGAWAGGWEWKKVGTLLQAHGHTVYRPTLTGQGEKVHLANPDIDLNTHITDIVNVILFEDLHDVVLMGHSYGGMVITGVADRVPERIKCVVYVDAFLPENGESLNTMSGRERPLTNGFLVPSGWPYPATKQPPYTVPHPGKTLSQPEVLKGPSKLPTVYILTVERGAQKEADTFYKSYQRAEARGWFTETMEGDHVVNQTHPVELVKLLEEAPGQGRVGK